MVTPSIQWSRSVGGDEFYKLVQQFIWDKYGGTSVPVSTICKEDYMVQVGVSRLAPSPTVGRASVAGGTEPSGPPAFPILELPQGTKPRKSTTQLGSSLAADA